MRPPSRDRTPAAPNAESGVPVFHIPSLLAYVSTACVLSLALWIPFAPARFASALALAAVFPGYALLRFTRIDLAPLERFALAVTVALSASTVAMHLAGSLLHRADPAFMRLVLGALAIGSAILAGAGAPAPGERPPRRFSAASAATLALCLAFSLAITFLSHYITPDNWPGTLKDNSKYLFIIPELQVHIPPNNVFFLPEGAQPLGYYYFLHLAMAVLANAGGVSVTTAFLAGCLLVTALSALVPFIVVQALFSERAARWATFLRTFIGGFDWIPYCLLLTIANALENRPWTWMQLTFCDEQWNAWFGSRVIVPLTHHWWFPQHEFALVVSLAWILLLFRKPAWRLWLLVMPPLLVMMAGCSVYYTLAAAPAYGVYILACIWRKRYRAALGASAAGAVALLLGAPYIRELLAAAQRPSGGLSFGIVQSLRYPHEWFGCAFAERFLGVNAWTKLLDLPLNYFLEYGLNAIGLAAFLRWARRTRWTARPDHAFFFTLGGVAFLLATFVRAKQGCNEFGYHAHQASMAVAIALTAQWLAAKTEAKSWRSWQIALVALALLISLAETHWGIRRVRGHILRIPPERVHPVARMAKEVRAKLPANAVVQGIPSFDGIYRPQAYYLPGAVIADTFDAATFAADPARFADTHNLILNGFATPDPALGYAVFLHLGVTHVIVGRHESDFLREHANSDAGLQKFANPGYFVPVYVSKDVSLYALKPLANPPRLQLKPPP